MNFELKVPENGVGYGTTVKLDGRTIDYVTRVELSIPVDGVAILKLHVIHADANGNFFVVGKGDDQALATRTRSFGGSFTLTGDIQELAVLRNVD